MNNKRLTQLLNFHQAEPDDPFLKYGIGMEYLGMNELDSALDWFQKTQAAHPDYLAVYYQLGKLSFLQGDATSSQRILKLGIQLATEKRNLKTRSELIEMYEDLFDEEVE